MEKIHDLNETKQSSQPYTNNHYLLTSDQLREVIPRVLVRSCD